MDMKVLLNLKAVIDRQREDLSSKDAQLHERSSQIERVGGSGGPAMERCWTPGSGHPPDYLRLMCEWCLLGDIL